MNNENNVINFDATEDKRREDSDKSHQRYSELLKSLDEPETARHFRDKKFKQATELLGELFAGTCPDLIPPENRDWAQELMIEFLEIFQIRHANFDRSQLAEDLQDYTFRESMSYFRRYMGWKRDTLAERGLDEYGVEFEEEPEPSQAAQKLAA